jgi:hypothetical protein
VRSTDILRLWWVLQEGDLEQKPPSPRLFLKTRDPAGHQWLTPIIPATQEAEIRRMEVQSQPGQNSSRDPISKKPSPNRAGGVA